MKKLLYIFTFALLVVACDKYEDGFDIAPTAIELEEVDASVDFDFDIDALTTRLTRLSKAGGPTKPSLAASKLAVTGSYIKLISGVDNGNYFEFLFSDDIDSCRIDEYPYLEVIYLVLNASSYTEIRVGDHSGENSILLGTIEQDFSFLYTITFSEGLLVNLTDYSATVVDSNSGTSFIF